ncbi:MAG: maleylpyruvate isomerase family mycothiol-dependent enzyme [Actinomycetota bacterium]
MTTSRQQTIENLNTSYDQLEQLMARLSPSDWDVQSLCPDWTVRGVVTHLASVEHALDGWLPTEDDNAPPFDRVGPWTSQADAMSTEELVAATTEIFASRRELLATTTDEQFATASMTPVGPGTYHRFMDVRVFDFWVHERDITTPLGWDTSDGGPVAERSLDEVDMSMGYIVGKKIGLPDGMGIAFEVTGPITRSIYAKVDGRAARVEALDDPDVTVTADAVAFVQLACGRVDPQQMIDAGRISWTGDATWGEKAARNLAFTM